MAHSGRALPGARLTPARFLTVPAAVRKVPPVSLSTAAGRITVARSAAGEGRQSITRVKGAACTSSAGSRSPLVTRPRIVPFLTSSARASTPLSSLPAEVGNSSSRPPSRSARRA